MVPIEPSIKIAKTLCRTKLPPEINLEIFKRHPILKCWPDSKYFHPGVLFKAQTVPLSQTKMATRAKIETNQMHFSLSC